MQDALFVKIDGYKNILRDVESTRQLLINLREAVIVLKKVSEVKERSIATFIENLEKVNEKIVQIENEFPKINSIVPPDPMETSEIPDQKDAIESSVRSLHGELESLRSELKGLQ